MIPGIKVGPYNEDRIKRAIERAENDVHVYGSPTRKGKRFRSAFTTEQVNYLEKEFRKYPYVGNSRRKDIADVLDISERAVKIWFQNRRMKEKKDIPNKEANSDKQMEVNKILNSFVKTTEDDSLPIIPTTENPVQIEVKFATAKPETNKGKLSCQSIASNTNDFSIVVKNNSKLITMPTETSKPSLSLKKNSPDSNDALMKDKSRIPSIHHVKNSSPKNNEPWVSEYQKMDYHNYQPPRSPAAMPHDLSSKPAAPSQGTRAEQKFPDVTSSSSEDIPFHSWEYYSSPCLPPGQIVWNPVSMAQLITSASMPGSIGPNLSIMKKNCNCDCHKIYGYTMMLQNNPNPNVQYVLSAVPFPNSSPKC